eukprot:TRINITY_DN2606_c0_g1_i1.p1 TRINITY_DN2606_c0_g1~~TRINITY_DN2606_c0_g1_i1.p1  ORF type:complete len:289 (-),score=33.92 TRINITY_DN2606_c0_g1_i1:37-903(-)
MWEYIVLVVAVYYIYMRFLRKPDLRKKFSNKSIVIVGASSGIGAELVNQLCQFGPNLVLVARTKEKLEAIRQEAVSKGAKKVSIFPADVTDPEQCKQLVEFTEREHGAIDILFLNAGIGLSSTLFAIKDPKVLENVFKVDFFGAMYPAFYALPALRKSRGHIVVTSSVYAKVVGRGVSAYCSAKHALHGFFDCLRIEEARNAIKVTLVCPGYVSTPIHDRSLDGEGKEIGKHKKSAILAWTEISLKGCCSEILRATALNDKQVSFPFVASLVVKLREILGSDPFDRLV